MITYKEFEVIRTMLKIKPTVQNLATEVYNKKHYYVFKSKEEVEELIASPVSYTHLTLPTKA